MTMQYSRTRDGAAARIALEACMTPEDLPSLLRALRQENSERRPDCPDEHLIAAYVDGALGDDRREGIGEHLADCGHCLALVGLLSRERTANASQPVAELVVAPDQSRVRLESRRTGSSTPQWAAAAVVVVALGALVRLSQPMYPTGHSTTGSNAPTTRTAAASTHGLTLLSPRRGCHRHRERVDGSLDARSRQPLLRRARRDRRRGRRHRAAGDR